MLTQDGVAWFVDGGRMRAERFCQLVPQYDLDIQLYDEERRPLAAPRVGQYQLIEIRHRNRNRKGAKSQSCVED